MQTDESSTRRDAHAKRGSEQLGSSLFRQEVLDAKRFSWLGEIRIKAPSWHVAMAVFAGLCLFVIAVMISVLSYSRYVKVQGITSPITKSIPVVADATATIGAVLVTEGAIVHAGDPLATLLRAEADGRNPGRGITMENSFRRASILRSRVDGTVLEVRGRAGDFVEEDSVVVNILPTSATIGAILFVPPEAMGAIAVHDPIKLQYKYNGDGKVTIFPGIVTSISPNALTNAQLLSLGGIPSRQPQFRADLTIAPFRDVMGNVTPNAVRYGIPLEASIVVERKRILDMFAPPKRLQDTARNDSQAKHVP